MAHAGVDAGLGQRVHGARFVAVELHEHVVPDLDVAVAVFLGASRRPTIDAFAVVVEDLGAGPAGAGVAHRPEIVGGVARALVVADADNAFLGYADVVVPDIVGFVVLGVDRDPQLLGRQLQHRGEVFPRVLDRILLEVVAEAEVAQHLEVGVVARGVADVLEVVVLAAGAYAALRRHRAGVGALVLAGEHVLELHHAGVGDQLGGVVGRYLWAGGDDGVALGGEEIEEALADGAAFHI